jgi:hypothetical protein
MKPRIVQLMLLMAVGLMLLSACKPTIPKEYIQPDDMEDLLYDYYVAQGIPADPKSKAIDYDHRYKTNLVLKKHGVTQAELDSSLRYYYTYMEELYKIYGNVQKRLSERALELGASTMEVERYTTQSLTGDTTDVWENSRQMVILPQPPYNVMRFSQKADSSYHQGDSFLMTFGNTFLVQSGSKNATVVVTVRYENDSIISHNTNVSQVGNTTLRIPACNLRAKELSGYIYMSKRQGIDNENDMCVLLLDHIQLVRFHHKNNDDEPSTPTSNAADTLKNDSLKNDSLKSRRHKLGERPMPAQFDNKQLMKPVTK